MKTIEKILDAVFSDTATCWVMTVLFLALAVWVTVAMVIQ